MAFDRNDPVQLQELKDEVTLDPTGIGYAPDSTTSGVLEPINAPNPATPLRKPKISAAKLRTATTKDAYDGLLPDTQEWFRWVTGSNGFEEENVEVTDDLELQLTGSGAPNASMWAASDRTAMVAAMDLIINVPASRAQNLWGFDTIITRDDWIAARNS